MIPSLAHLLSELAVELRDVVAVADGDVTTWTRNGREFASLGPLGAEFRLDHAIAAAATRTPDAGPSHRGPEWVLFNPRELDGHAVDRARAWFELAHRFSPL